MTDDSGDDDEEDSSEMSYNSNLSENSDIDKQTKLSNKNKDNDNKNGDFTYSQIGSQPSTVQAQNKSNKNDDKHEKEEKEEKKERDRTRSLAMRTWQRLINAKSIYICWTREYESKQVNVNYLQTMVHRLSRFKNIEKIDAYFPVYVAPHGAALRVLKTITLV